MKLTERLSKARSLRGDTLETAAKAIGCSVAFLQRLEKKEGIRPKMSLLHSIANYYDLNRDTVVIEAGKIPEDVYWRIVNNPELINIIREYDASEYA